MNKLNKITLVSILLGSGFYWFSYYYIDQSLAILFHHASHTDFLYNFSQAITYLGAPKVSFAFIIISFIIAMSILFKQPQNKLANNLLFMGLAMTAAIFFATVFKYFLGRYRPELLFQQGLYGFHYSTHQFLMNSTPSGHATRIFVFVTALCLIWRKGSPLFIALGVLVCLSRLVLEFHYLGDVVFGSLLGSLVTLWIAKVYYSLTISNSSLSFLNQT